MKHSPGFLSLVQAAQAQVQEISLEQAKRQMESLPETVLMDVREDHEWLSEHAAGAVHLGKGILERDIETRFPDRQTPIIMYCGGGYRSVWGPHDRVFRRLSDRPCRDPFGVGFSACGADFFPYSADPVTVRSP